MAIATGTFSLVDLNDAIVAGTAPANPSIDTLWLDTSVTPNMMKKWNGSAWIEVGELDPNYSDTIDGIQKSIDDITSDSLIDYTERKILKDRITEIIGYVIADSATTLPTITTLDGSSKGEVYSVRKQALNAGMATVDSLYIAVATQYTNLKTYLDGLTTVKIWDLSTVNKSKTISVTKSTFRDKFQQYNNAVNALKEAIEAKQKQNVDDVVVGGANLLELTGMKNYVNKLSASVGTGVATSLSFITESTAPYGVAAQILRTDTSTTSGGRYWSAPRLTVGKKYTWSGWVKGSGTWTIGHEQGGQKNVALTTTWTYVTFTFTATNATYNSFTLYRITGQIGGELNFHSLKLEEGDKATSWNPHVKDITDAIDQADGKGQSALDNLSLNGTKWSDAAEAVTLWRFNGQNSIFNGAAIATGTIFAQSLLLADWTNLVENPDFENDTLNTFPLGYYPSYEANRSKNRVEDISTFQNGNGSNKALAMDALQSSNNSIYVNNLIPVTAGEEMFIQATARYLNTAGTGDGRVGFLCYDAKKQSLDIWNTPLRWNESPKTTAFVTKSGSFKVPDGTAYLRFYMSFSTNGETTNKFYVDNLIWRRKANADLIVDGTIEGRHIKGASVEFDKLQGGTATLGGANNVNGQLIVLDANGDLAVGLNTLDDDGVTYYSGFQNIVAESLYISKNIKAPNIVETTTDVINLYVDPINGNDDNPGTSWAAGALATIQEAINRLPKVLSHNVRIQMHYSNASEVYENVLVQGFTGSGALTIDFQNTSNVLYGSLQFMYSTINTVMNSGKYIATANQSPIYAEGVSRLAMNNSIVDAKGLTAYAVYVSNSFADLRGCGFYNGTNSQVIAAYGGRADVIDCIGSGGTNGVRAYRSSIVAGTGTAPTGSSKNALGDQGGQCTGTWTYTTSTAPSTPAPSTYTTVTVTANSGNSWRSGFGGQWYGGNVRQALWTSSYGRYMGYWFFGTQFNQFNGKTITKVRIWAQRYNGGGSSASKNARFVLHGYQLQPSSSSQPTFYGGLSTSTAYTAGFKWGESKWIDATAAFKNSINQTSVYGIGLWMYADSPYMIFNNNLKVEVTYKN
ncbi:hypothetical protein [Priestia megaterium]|uniref:hypothetical protein n=1 Tax=Priestia megaterium TaxID=1404 RepID=UPI00136473F5|nr:hypothetical protein [Priestia megaterium]